MFTSLKSMSYLRYESKRISIDQCVKILNICSKNLMAYGINKILYSNLKNPAISNNTLN